MLGKKCKTVRDGITKHGDDLIEREENWPEGSDLPTVMDVERDGSLELQFGDLKVTLHENGTWTFGWFTEGS